MNFILKNCSRIVPKFLIPLFFTLAVLWGIPSFLKAATAPFELEHIPILYASPYEDLVIRASPTRPDKIKDLILFFRGAGKRLYESQYMSRSSNGVYSGVIPSNVITGKGVVYFIAARDQKGNEMFLFGNPDRPHGVVARSLILIQSAQLNIYEDVIQGIKREANAELKVFDLNTLGPGGNERLMSRLEKEPPEVMITLGFKAAKLVRESAIGKRVPVINSMIADPRDPNLRVANSTGVSFDIAVKQSLSSFRKIIPNVRKVGMIYDPNRTGDMVQEARALAPSMGFEILATRIEDGGELPAILRAFEHNIDAFWLIPDSTVIQGKNFNALLNFSRQHRIPLFVFSKDLVKKGALVALSPDYEGIGVQTGRLVRKILEGTQPQKLPSLYPDKLAITLNMDTARTLRLEGIAQRIVEYAADYEYPLQVYK